MKISILTLFPEMFKGPLEYSILKRAQIKKLITIHLVNIRDFGIGKHKIVDDRPYGGGRGMILRVDVLGQAIEFSRDPLFSKRQQKVVLLDPHGKTFTQNTAQKFSKLKHLILVCGHYEGVDERVKKLIDGEISVGNFILTGGEIPAMLITDAVARLVKGVLKDDATEIESFSKDPSFLEYPQYTRPGVHRNLTVPKILFSGNHAKIQKWRDKKISIRKKREMI